METCAASSSVVIDVVNPIDSFQTDNLGVIVQCFKDKIRECDLDTDWRSPINDLSGEVR